MKKIFTIILFIAFFLFIKASVVCAQVNTQDSLALVDLYNSTNGAHWKSNTNWLSSAPVSTWYGIYVSNSRVENIGLVNNNLNGSIPATFGNLKHLQDIYLSKNNISGGLPANIFSKMPDLTELQIDHNQLTGSVPGNFATGYLNSYFLDYNNLNGALPDSLGDHTYVRVLDFSHNQITGNISSTFGNISAEFIFLNNNLLTGNIPASLGNNSMSGLWLSYNQLTGTIPNFTSKWLGELYLDHNELTGNIADTISKYAYFSELHLDYNQLSGSIPASLGTEHTWPFKIYLNNNQLTGNIPPELSSLTVYLYVGHNHLSGKIPAEFGTAPFIQVLDVNNNDIEGTIPAALGKSPHLVVLDLAHNHLRDSIPSSLGNIKYLKSLVLSGNELKGNIPASFKNLKYLRHLRLNYNLLSGIVPAFIDSLPNIKEFTILKNRYTFDGLETLVSNNNIDTFKYDEQKKIAINQSGSRLSVYAGGTLSNNVYNWYKDGSLVATITSDSTYQPTQDGNYSVAVTNSIVTTLTLYSDTINYSEDNNLIASKMNNNSFISLYPNPAKTNATLSFYADGKYTVTIADFSGKILQTKSGVANKGTNIIQLDVSNYASGIYFITIVDEKNRKQTLRLNKG